MPTCVTDITQARFSCRVAQHAFLRLVGCSQYSVMRNGSDTTNRYRSDSPARAIEGALTVDCIRALSAK
jgi:hypothetical protein